MKKTLTYLLATALLTASVGMVHAQEFRVGYINSEKIMRDSDAAKAAQAKLEQEFSKKEKEIGALESSLKSAAEKFDRDAPTLSESQRASRQKQLIEQDRDFQRRRREFQEDLNARKNEELQAVLERANRTVKQVAEAEKFDLVLQEAVYINPKYDITDKVIKSLNAK